MSKELIITYLTQLCEDFENHGDKFEFTEQDAHVVREAVQLLTEATK